MGFFYLYLSGIIVLEKIKLGLEMSDYKQKLDIILNMDYKKLFFDILKEGNNQDLQNFINLMGSNFQNILGEEIPTNIVRKKYKRTRNEEGEEPFEILIKYHRSYEMLKTFKKRLDEKHHFFGDSENNIIEKIYFRTFNLEDKNENDVIIKGKSFLEYAVDMDNYDAAVYCIKYEMMSSSLDIVLSSMSKSDKMFDLIIENCGLRRVFFDASFSNPNTKPKGIYLLVDFIKENKDNRVIISNLRKLLNKNVEIMEYGKCIGYEKFIDIAFSEFNKQKKHELFPVIENIILSNMLNESNEDNLNKEIKPKARI